MGADSRVTVTEEITTLLIRSFGVEPGDVRPEASLRELGMDSLALEEMRVLLEERLNIDLEDVQLTSRETVGQLATVVGGKTAG
ncbi:acyl carrier protein [Amycolatopsis sp. A133]|uniref:acyl carrier protein n=1 Tax=Amycolatopsis sp. A133 TaxID=3064472 RepID=UPI0027EF5D87|nr:acyl carrier protein [Amycolatopsis sp. A133]MDQ7810313.1 acyl carrier protein [Amycolatopsis sp. A133]